MIIARTRYSEIIADLVALREACQELGVGCPSDRLATLVRRIGTLESLQGDEAGLRRVGDEVGSQTLAWNLVEALEFRDVWRAFGPDLGSIRALLELAMEGPADPGLEQIAGDKARARNTMFELRLGALLIRRGVEVEFREPDLRASMVGRDLLIACKRPSTRVSLTRNVQKAASQIRKARVDAPGGVGIVAVSVSRMLEDSLPPLPGTLFAATLSDRLADHLERELCEEVKRAQEKLTRGAPEAEILLLHIMRPIWVEDEAILTSAEQLVVHGSGRLDPEIREELKRVLTRQVS